MRQLASDDLPISFDGVTLVAGGVTILDRVSLSIQPGQPTVLIGPNGAGKSSLLRAAMGLIPVSSGVIAWGGKAAPSLARRAIVFQRPAMLRRSAAGNVRYALPADVPRGERSSRVAALLSQVGLAGLEARPAKRLSGGEQQRLALARALARDPDVLFLDELTSSLDPYAARAVEDVLRSASGRGIKVVMSTHDLGEAKRLAGDIVLLHRGRIVEAGCASEFFAAPRTEAARRFIGGELLV